jgi:pilus assembly protein CpaB
MSVAVLAAMVASLGVYQAVRRMPAREVEVPAAYVVAASGPIDMGVKLTREHVKLVAWPARSPVTGTFSKLDAVVGRGLMARVAENEPITAAKLAPVESGAGLSPSIKPGMRAMSVKVNEVIGVAGFVTPGAHVDVLVTLRDEKTSTARVVVSDVEVLTSGTRGEQGEPVKAKPTPNTVVTLMVTPTDAERIALAATDGQIILALRNPLDKAATTTAGVRRWELTGGAEPVPAAAPRPVIVRQAPLVAQAAPLPSAPAPQVAAVVPPSTTASGPAVYTVETIKAGKRDKEMVR